MLAVKRWAVLFSIFILLQGMASAGIWVKQNETAGGYRLWSVYFINASEGYASGNNGLLLRTTNRGRTWSTITTNTTEAFYGVWAGNNEVRLVSGSGNFSYGNISNNINFSLTKLNTANYPLFGLWYADANNGFIASDFDSTSNNSVYRTSNAYAWTGSNLLYIFEGIHGTSASNVFAVGAGSVTNRIGAKWNGTAWATQTISTNPGNLWGVRALDADKVFAVGDFSSGQNFFKTTNGGTSWTGAALSPNYSYRSIAFANTANCWTVGEFGAILYSTNEGTSWTAQASGLTTTLESVFAVDANNVWAAGGNSSVLKYVVSPECTTITPSSGEAGSSVICTIEGTNFQGTAASTTDAPSISGSGITVNSVTFNSSTSITADLTVASTASAGAVTLTVTNPDTGVGTISFTVTSSTGTTTTTTSSTTTTTTTTPITEIKINKAQPKPGGGAILNLSFNLRSNQEVVVQLWNATLDTLIAEKKVSGALGSNVIDLFSDIAKGTLVSGETYRVIIRAGNSVRSLSFVYLQ